MARLKVSHRTVYRYSEPVAFSEHRFMCRPRDSHDLRLVDTGISISPQPTLRWIHDVFSNSVLIASFEGKASELVFDSTFVAEHYPVQANVDMIEPHAERLPFSYEAGEIPDLARCNERQYADPEHRVDA
ncbi:MAG: hypothetical protein M0P63_14540, partial [Azoarcus sp.]|nr:hypothetical protein [Azoarcus sp.]